MLLWLRADVDAATNLWEDQSGNNHDAGTVSDDPTITTNGLNFNPVYEFNDDRLVITNGLLDTGTTYDTMWTYTVVNPNTLQNSFVFLEAGQSGENFHIKVPSGSPDYRIRLGNTTGGILLSSPPTFQNEFGIYTMSTTNTTTTPFGTNQAISKNGLRIATSGTFDTMGGNSAQNMIIGSNSGGSRGFVGQIAEIIIFDEIPTATKQQKIESYLALKYGITLNNTDNIASITEGDYLASDEITKYWNYTANSTFHNDVAGIGRDDTQNFIQKQSKSINSDAIISIKWSSTTLAKW